MHIFFESWESVIRTLVITIAAYIGLIVMLRISGNRTLSKMNAFDYIVTIALGSSFAAVALNKSIALIDGLLVFILLIGMQFIIASLSVRFPLIKHTITGEPVLILYKGEFLDEILRKERITKSDVIAKVREKG